jgi:hypothetical protein
MGVADNALWAVYLHLQVPKFRVPGKLGFALVSLPALGDQALAMTSLPEEILNNA